MSGEKATEKLQIGDPRLVVRWTRRYARSRTISFLVQWVVIVFMILVIGLAANLTNTAHRTGSTGLFGLSIGLMGLSVLGLAWFSLSRWSGELIWNITQWLYGGEGYAAFTGPSGHKTLPLWLTGLGGGLVAYHLVIAMLVSFNHISLRNMQPFSAAYMAPYLVILIVYQGLGFWAWIWPALYALHAALLLAGAPIRFPAHIPLLDMIVPVFGYGLVAILAGHAYSRYALWNLKRVTRTVLPEFPTDADGDPETGGNAGDGAHE